MLLSDLELKSGFVWIGYLKPTKLLDASKAVDGECPFWEDTITPDSCWEYVEDPFLRFAKEVCQKRGGLENACSKER